jgi:hypothetical protein
MKIKLVLIFVAWFMLLQEKFPDIVITMKSQAIAT